MRKTWFSSKDRVHLVVQFARRIQIVAERLLDHHAHAALLRLRHSLRAQVLDDAEQNTPARLPDRRADPVPMPFSCAMRSSSAFNPA